MTESRFHELENTFRWYLEGVEHEIRPLSFATLEEAEAYITPFAHCFAIAASGRGDNRKHALIKALVKAGLKVTRIK